MWRYERQQQTIFLCFPPCDRFLNKIIKRYYDLDTITDNIYFYNQMSRTTLLLLLIVAISAQQLVELKDKTYTQITGIPFDFKKNFTLGSDWFVMFYAPWCHHCKQTLPEWVKLASLYTNNTHIAVVNCDNEIMICGSLSIQGYPTLILFKTDGTAYDYRSHRKY